MSDARCERARRLLNAAGVAAPVRALGPEGEIAAVAASPDAFDVVRRLAPELRKLGFRYVALDPTAVGHETES